MSPGPVWPVFGSDLSGETGERTCPVPSPAGGQAQRPTRHTGQTGPTRRAGQHRLGWTEPTGAPAYGGPRHTSPVQSGLSPVSVRSRSAVSVSVRFWSGFGPVSVRFRSRSGFGPVSVRFRSGFSPVSVPFRSRSGPDGRNRDYCKMQINAHGRMLFPKPTERGQGGERHPWQNMSRKQFTGPIN